MKIAVIGGSGFIGAHVVDKLIDAGHEVTVFDIMSPHRSDVRHITIDILDRAKTAIALTGDYEAVYMLAAVADVNDVYKFPIASAQVNIIAVANVLEAARSLGIKRVILASTVWVYSMSDELVVNEDTSLSPKKVNHVYTASKLSAELLCCSYKALYNLDYTILRYGIPYGPGGRKGTVIANFVGNALENKPLVIQGDGSQYRSFIYVEDLAAGNVAALHENAANQIYNLDGNEKISVLDVAKNVSDILGNTTIQFIEGRLGDARGKEVVTLKAQRELNWEAKTSFREGLKKYVEWYSSKMIKSSKKISTLSSVRSIPKEVELLAKVAD